MCQTTFSHCTKCHSPTVFCCLKIEQMKFGTLENMDSEITRTSTTEASLALVLFRAGLIIIIAGLNLN